MATPWVSAIIPAFDRADTIERAIRSVDAQTFKHIEVIVIDDGSSDGTGRAARNSGCKNLRVLRHERNLGAAAARNTGIKAAAGRFLAFLDSDDFWHPDKLARQIMALEHAAPNIKACASGYRLFKDGRSTSICPDIPLGQFRDQILFGCSISPGTTLVVDRAAFEVVGPFDESMRRLEDWDWLLRYTQHYDLILVPSELATIHVGYSQIGPVSDDDDPVIRSIRQIELKHGEAIGRSGGASLRKFRSTLMIELAARMYHKHKAFRAAGYVVASLCIYPLRNTPFYQTLWRSFRQACLERIGIKRVL
jgi:glycosyltransferase involved in cell wall biosynthesis